jgi:aminoglycoside phosphotransferase (APT) family kinase protein
MTSEVAFVDGDAPCVIKRCRDRRYLEWLSREHRVLLALENASLPVPRVLGYAKVDNSEKGHEAWLVMSRLEGRPLWNEMLHANSQRRARLLQLVGELLNQLHATAVPIGLRSTAWLDRMLAEARENLNWCDGTGTLLASLDDHRPEPVPEVLIHGDLALDNVLVSAEDAMSLIDWSGGAQGDPRYDLALALHTEPEIELSEAELAAFFEGYGGKAIDRSTRRWFESLYEFF